MLATFGKSLVRPCPTGRRALRVFVAKAAGKPAAPKKADPESPGNSAAASKRGKKASSKKIIRAPSAYNLFYKDRFNAAKAKHPDGGLADWARSVREAWGNASAAEKKHFEDESKKLQEAAAAKRAEQKGPTRPPNAYILFVMQRREATVAAHPGLKATEITKLLGDQWRGLPEEEKRSYKDKAQKLFDEFKAKQTPAAA